MGLSSSVVNFDNNVYYNAYYTAVAFIGVPKYTFSNNLMIGITPNPLVTSDSMTTAFTALDNSSEN
tara:strand:+ start:644 stop:841 length:198 start_codon:yes stop_codon:yes gene_type:complete